VGARERLEAHWGLAATIPTKNRKRRRKEGRKEGRKTGRRKERGARRLVPPLSVCAFIFYHTIFNWRAPSHVVFIPHFISLPSSLSLCRLPHLVEIFITKERRERNGPCACVFLLIPYHLLHLYVYTTHNTQPREHSRSFL
jgi:hypothetical protein